MNGFGTEIKIETKELSGPMRAALAEVERMASRGLTTVPLKPSQEMLTAGARAGKVTIDTVMRVYAAMLEAAD
ncbi:hypothetical protein [Oleisolibacter albus]|uniref:hypothetical protein n=1 Tax=Oleisolibacter albus TaxID=2171757 RepID=UPI0012D77BCA|nr:hypothetical protein [Oleisolibacter albus]